MKCKTPEFGLVLAGGGAKGAYHAGALSYLASIGFKPQIIAGTSIGALNGAILSANQSFEQGVYRLNELWDQLGQTQILRPNPSTVLKTMVYAGQAVVPAFNNWVLDFLVETKLIKGDIVIFDPKPIEDFLRRAVNLETLKDGIELWVTAFPSLKIPGLKYDLLTALIDLLRSRTGTSAHWFCVQDCEDEEVLYNSLLASAAIPIAFPRREVNSQSYVDGGLADNVPLKALAARNCTHVIVIHLDNGSIWSRYDFPDQTIIEIRPEAIINKSNTPLLGDVDTILDFSPERISDLKKRGYQDAKNTVEPIIKIFEIFQGMRLAQGKATRLAQQVIDDPPLI